MIIMDYKKHYKALCSSRQQLNRQWTKPGTANRIYYEKHHIVPVHENGSNEEQNKVLLTAREHFIAHWLFAKWKQTRKAWAALSMMQQKHAGRRLNSKQYEICKLANSKMPMPAETREKIRAKAIGRPSAIKGRKDLFKQSAEAKEKISKSLKGHVAWNKSIPWSEEHKNKISEKMLGREAPNKGLPMAESAKIKQAKTNLAKTHSRLQAYCPLLVGHKELGLKLFTDSQCLLAFCKSANIEIRRIEALLKHNAKSVKGWRLIDEELRGIA